MKTHIIFIFNNAIKNGFSAITTYNSSILNIITENRKFCHAKIYIECEGFHFVSMSLFQLKFIDILPTDIIYLAAYILFKPEGSKCRQLNLKRLTNLPKLWDLNHTQNGAYHLQIRSDQPLWFTLPGFIPYSTWKPHVPGDLSSGPTTTIGHPTSNHYHHH